MYPRHEEDNTLALPPGARRTLERLIVSTSLDSSDCLLAAVKVLRPNPFRCEESYILNPIFNWCLGRFDRGVYDGARNRDLLADTLKRRGWPKGWSAGEIEGYFEMALAWTPLMDEPARVASIAGALAADDAAFDQLVDVRHRLKFNLSIAMALAQARNV